MEVNAIGPNMDWVLVGVLAAFGLFVIFWLVGMRELNKPEPPKKTEDSHARP